MKPVTDPNLLQQLESEPAQQQPGSIDPLASVRDVGQSALNFVSAIPRGIMTGLTSAPNPSLVPIGDELDAVAPTRGAALETAKAALPVVEGRAGRIGEAVGEGLGNPLSYLGPGSLPLKVGGAALSAAASEAGGQAAEGTPWETPARIAGALAGGGAAVKAFGPGAPKAATPTYRELKEEATRLYTEARNSGVEFHPQGVSRFATQVEQELAGPNHGFTGGANGDARKTFSILELLQNPPAGATITAGNVDALRKNLGRLSRETVEGKPTPDAAAASILLSRLNGYLESPPSGHVMAGDAERYVRATKEANANYAAGQRVKDWQTRIDNAVLDAEGQIAGSLENRQKIAARSILKNPKASAGMSADELDQLDLINGGGPLSNVLRNLGRGGAGVVPIGMQIATGIPLALQTGGASVAPQAAVAAALYGARKGSEAITNSRVNALADILAKRSPLFQQRQAALPSADHSPGVAAVLRAMMGAN